MTRAERIAHGLILKHGPKDALWKAWNRVLGYIAPDSDVSRLAFWQIVRNECYRAIGKVGATEVWS